MTEQNNIPQEVMEKIEVNANSFAKKPPFKLGIYSTSLHQYQFCFEQGAIFGYHLRDEEVNELKEEIDYLKNKKETITDLAKANVNWQRKTRVELEQQLQKKEQQINELREDYDIQNYKYTECIIALQQKEQLIKELEKEVTRLQNLCDSISNDYINNLKDS